MKIKMMFFGLTLAAVSVGALAGVLAPSAIETPVVEADAVEPLAEGEILLRIVHEGETTDDEIISTLNVYNWKDGDNNGWPGNDIEGEGSEESFVNTFSFKKRQDGRYTFTLLKVGETLWDKFIINSDNGGQTGNSAWMGLDATNEYILTINADGGVVGGGWKKIAQPYTSDMLRLWVDRGLAAHEQGYLMLHYWKDGVDTKTLPTGYPEITTGHWLAYYDVPKADLHNAHMQFIRHDSTGVYAQTFNDSRAGGQDNVYAAGDNAEIFFLWDNGTQFGKGSLEAAERIVPVANLKLVLEGYFTCLDDADNGYANWDRVKETWINYTDAEGVGHWRTNGDLTDLVLDDFETEADYATGNRTTGSIDGWSKYLKLEAEWNAANAQSPLFGVSFGNMDNGIIIAVVTLLSVVSVSAIVFISMKRRHSKKN